MAILADPVEASYSYKLWLIHVILMYMHQTCIVMLADLVQTRLYQTHGGKICNYLALQRGGSA